MWLTNNGILLYALMHCTLVYTTLLFIHLDEVGHVFHRICPRTDNLQSDSELCGTPVVNKMGACVPEQHSITQHSALEARNKPLLRIRNKTPHLLGLVRPVRRFALPKTTNIAQRVGRGLLPPATAAARVGATPWGHSCRVPARDALCLSCLLDVIDPLPLTQSS